VLCHCFIEQKDRFQCEAKPTAPAKRSLDSSHKSFVTFWQIEFFKREVGSESIDSDSDSGLADETKQISSPCHFMYQVDPSASSARFFTGQQLTHGL